MIWLVLCSIPKWPGAIWKVLKVLNCWVFVWHEWSLDRVPTWRTQTSRYCTRCGQLEDPGTVWL